MPLDLDIAVIKIGIFCGLKESRGERDSSFLRRMREKFLEV